jgi:hypothetical protein
MLHRSPREEFGYDTGLWTLRIAAEASFEERLTRRRVSPETIRSTLARLLGGDGAASQKVDHLPPPPLRKKKGGAIG